MHQILKNPLYYGELHWAGKIYKGIHEPLISRDLYERVQEVMDEKGRRITGQQKHRWAFQCLLSCSHCGCARVAEIKKKQYVYYHCTGNKGNCPEKWVREEEIARQFGQAIGAIKMDNDVLNWVITALKESHSNEKKFHSEQLLSLQGQYEKLKYRLDAMYEDKLDGVITQDYYDRKSLEWKREPDDILRKIERRQGASRAYMDEGIKLSKLAQHAVMLCEKQTDQEKRRIIKFVWPNSIWKDGLLQLNFRKPFDIILENNSQFHKKMAAFPEKNDHFEFWLPLVDVLRNNFAGPSKEMMSTILIAQNQVKEGFFAVQQW